MKNILNVLIFLLITVSCKAQLQLDTLNYVKQFEINKAQYVNKPFSYLLDHMTQMQPKSHWSDTPFRNKKIVESSRFKFSGMDYSFKNAVTLNIIWQESFPESDVKYLQNKNEYYFTNEEKDFYKNKVVKDILVYK